MTDPKFDGWNYRVILSEVRGHKEYTVHEVYYGKDGSILAWSGIEACPYGETKKELAGCFKRMREALDRPVLVRGEMPGMEGK